MARLLLVEDDPMILNALTAFLREEGFETETADGQRAALELLSRHSFDLVLLDITLREGNGFDTCRAIKAQSSVPVFFLTASGDESSTVAGLDMGADDYIAKPFRPRELLSRIRSALRRSGADAARLTLGPLTLDTDKGEVYREGVPLALSALEYRMLLLLPGTGESSFPGTAFWRSCGIWGESLLTTIPLPCASNACVTRSKRILPPPGSLKPFGA